MRSDGQADGQDEAGHLVVGGARHQADCPGPADPRLSVLVAGTPVSLWWQKLQSRGGTGILGYSDQGYYNNCLEMHNAFLLLTTYLPGVYILAYNIQLFKIQKT